MRLAEDTGPGHSCCSGSHSHHLQQMNSYFNSLQQVVITFSSWALDLYYSGYLRNYPKSRNLTASANMYNYNLFSTHNMNKYKVMMGGMSSPDVLPHIGGVLQYCNIAILACVLQLSEQECAVAVVVSDCQIVRVSQLPGHSRPVNTPLLSPHSRRETPTFTHSMIN